MASSSSSSTATYIVGALIAVAVSAGIALFQRRGWFHWSSMSPAMLVEPAVLSPTAHTIVIVALATYYFSFFIYAMCTIASDYFLWYTDWTVTIIVLTLIVSSLSRYVVLFLLLNCHVVVVYMMNALVR